MRKLGFIVCLFLGLGGSPVLASYVDTFDGTVINGEFWAPSSSNGPTISQHEELVISGVSTDPSPNWKADAHVMSVHRWAAEGLALSVEMRVSGSGTGWWTGMYVGQDSDTWIHIFVGKDGNQAGHVGYAYAIDGAPVSGGWLSDQVGCTYGMNYSDGAMAFWMDGNLLGRQAISMSSVQVALGSNIRTQGDSIYATFDNFSISSVPEPSSTLAILSGIGGLSGLARRRSRK